MEQSSLLQSRDGEEKVQLPFSEKKQDAVLGHLLVNPNFFLQARNKIQPAWFEDPIAGKVYAVKLKFYEQYKRMPSVEGNSPGSPGDLQQWGDFLHEEGSIVTKMRKKVDHSIAETQYFGLDVIQSELEGWLRARLFKDTVNTTTKLYNAGRFPELYPYLNERVQAIVNAKFSEDEAFNFENYPQQFIDEQVESDHALTVGMTVFDRLLLSTGKGGSLLPGDTTVFLAPTNVGKTTTLITIIAANIKARKSVLFFTHEGRPEDITTKLWCSLLDVTKAELFSLMKTPEGVQRLDRALLQIKKYLVYVPYNKAGATIEDVEPMIRRRQQERIARCNGKGFDLLVCDYPAKLTTALARGGNMQKRHIDEIVYNYYVQLALEYKFHALLAIQANREGAKINRGQKEEGRFLTPEDVHESFAPMQTATNIISINRDPISAARNVVTFYICKSRSSETGFAVHCRSNYAHAITHSDALGGAHYRTTYSMVEKVDAVLDQYNGMAIPEHIQ